MCKQYLRGSYGKSCIDFSFLILKARSMFEPLKTTLLAFQGSNFGYSRKLTFYYADSSMARRSGPCSARSKRRRGETFFDGGLLVTSEILY